MPGTLVTPDRLSAARRLYFSKWRSTKTGEEVPVHKPPQVDEQQQQQLPFALVSPIWYLLCVGGMLLTFFVGFAEIEEYQQPSLLRIFLSLFYGRQIIIQLIFFAAIIIHLLEASLVLILCPWYLSSTIRFAWTLQTFLIGYPSLKPFLTTLEQHYLDQHKQQKRRKVEWRTNSLGSK